MSVPLLLILISGLLFVQFVWIATLNRKPLELLRDTKNGKLKQAYSILLFVMVAQLFSGFLLPIDFGTWNRAIVIIGLTIYEIGIAIAVWAKLTMRSNWGYPAQHDIERQKELVTNGPFRFSRNPIYIGLILMILGFGMATRSYLLLIVVPLFFFFNTVIAQEEKLLEKHFGKPYSEYKKRVRRFL